MKKLLLITGVVLTAYLILMTTVAPRSAAPSVSAADIVQEPPYLVTERDGCVAVYRNGSLMKTTDTLVSNLPKSDISRLKEGIRLQTEKELKAANSKLDHARLKQISPYDVTVRTGVSGLSAYVYTKPDLTSAILVPYEEGVRLEVIAQNRDWAQIYHGGTDQKGYMLLEDLEADLVEEEILEDD